MLVQRENFASWGRVTHPFFDMVAAKIRKADDPMNVWVELRDGTKHTYENVHRIVERAGKVEIRGGANWGDRILVVHDKAEIKNLGNSTTLASPRFK